MNVQIFKTYSHQGLCRAIDIFNFPDYYPSLTRILGYRFLFQYKDKDRRLAPNQQQLVTSIKKMVTENNNQENATVLMELVDILLEFSKKDGEELLAYLRRVQMQAKIVPPKTNGPKGTIYADSQSVHNSAITNTIKTVAKYLCVNFSPEFRYNDENDLKKAIKLKLETNSVFANDKNVLDEVLNRIYNDNATFEGYKTDRVLYSLWNWVSVQNNNELYNRIAEELFEMHLYCSTRILKCKNLKVISKYIELCFNFLKNDNADDIRKETNYKMMLEKIRKEKHDFVMTEFPAAISFVIKVSLKAKLNKINKK